MTAKSASVNNLLPQPFRFIFFNILSEKVFWEIEHETRSQKNVRLIAGPAMNFLSTKFLCNCLILSFKTLNSRCRMYQSV